MTRCVGIQLDEDLAFDSDARTRAVTLRRRFEEGTRCLATLNRAWSEGTCAVGRQQPALPW